MRRLVVLFVFLFTTSSAHALCVLAQANLRKGPGTKFPITWQVPQHTPLVDLEYKNGWYKVQDQDGDIHWAYQSTVTKSYQCMAIKVGQASLRAGPGTNFPYSELPSVGKYYAFKRIGFEPPWFQVEDDRNGKFWVHENLVWQPLKRMQLNF